MRYLIKFTKESDIKFISHLDLMRTIQKIIRRSELPIEYSKGFNPHMTLSLAQPLSVGVYSEGEYMDIVLVDEVDTDEVIKKLNEKSASGVKFLNATKIPIVENVKRVPQAMALIDAARYVIKIKYNNNENFSSEMETLLGRKEWVMLKKTKKGAREVDIKPLVKELKYWTKDDEVILNVVISSGSREHLSADLLVQLIKENTTGSNDEAFVDIKREEMYIDKDNELIPLYKCL